MENNKYNSGHNGNGSNDPGPISDQWLNCPCTASAFIADKFFAFKTPLSAPFSPKMEPAHHFQPDMVFSYMKMEKKKLGLWIDLTNITRFYNRLDIEARDCQYVNLKCRGIDETPSPEETRSFIEIVDTFTAQHPLEFVGIHCTHGFNRTGFMIVSYMVERMDCAVEAAIYSFANVRSPGIYKQDYINELFRRYDEEGDAIPVAQQPAWCLEYDDGDGGVNTNYDNSYSSSSSSHQNTIPNKLTQDNNLLTDNADDVNDVNDANDDVDNKKDDESSRSADGAPMNINETSIQGVQIITDQPRLGQLQDALQKICEFENNSYLGSQLRKRNPKRVPQQMGILQ